MATTYRNGKQALEYVRLQLAKYEEILEKETFESKNARDVFVGCRDELKNIENSLRTIYRLDQMVSIQSVRCFYKDVRSNIYERVSSVEVESPFDTVDETINDRARTVDKGMIFIPKSTCFDFGKIATMGHPEFDKIRLTVTKLLDVWRGKESINTPIWERGECFQFQIKFKTGILEMKFESSYRDTGHNRIGFANACERIPAFGPFWESIRLLWVLLEQYGIIYNVKL